MGKSKPKIEPKTRFSPLKIAIFATIVVAIAALVVTVVLTRRPIDLPASRPRTSALSFPLPRYSKGPADASVTLVEFGDYQCPTCAAFHPVVDTLLELHPEDLRIVFYHIPLVSVHPNAIHAAMAAEAAGEAGRFWEMHDLLMVNQAEWARENDPYPLFSEYAERLGIDVDQFRSAVKSDHIRAIIDADIRAAARLGVGSTLTFFVNDKPIRQLPRSLRAFDNIIVTAIQG